MELQVCIYIFLSITISMLSHNYCNAAKPWKSKCPVLTIPNAKIRIRARGRMAKIRCESDYTMIEGDRRLTCIKGKWNGRIPQCISNGCSLDTVPNGGFIELYDGALLHFHCNPGYTLMGSPALFCDGSKWNASYPLCEVPPPNPDHLSCTFETSDLCGWVQDHVDDLDWKWTTGTNNAFTGSLGAKTDHTLNVPAGHYIFADSKDDWFSGSVARMFSPILSNPVQTPACVIFWYHMNGPTTGSLNVYLKPESDPFEILVPAMTVTGFNEDAWKMAYVGLPDIEEEFLQVIFEAKGGDGHISDVAVDDFLVTSGDACIESELKVLEQQSTTSKVNEVASSQDNSSEDDFHNNPIVRFSKKPLGKRTTTTVTAETEETDHTYIPYSTSSLETYEQSTTLGTHFKITSPSSLESTLKATTPRKVYISSPKPTLPIILVISTPPANVNLTSYLPRKTLTPIPNATVDTTMLVTKPVLTLSTVTETVPTIKLTKETTPNAFNNNSSKESTTKFLKISTTPIPTIQLTKNSTENINYPPTSKQTTVRLKPSTFKSTTISFNKPQPTHPTLPSKSTLKWPNITPTSLPPKISSKSPKYIPFTTLNTLKSLQNERSTLPTRIISKSSDIKPLTLPTKIPSKFSENTPSKFLPKNTSTSLLDTPSPSLNVLHNRPLPGVVILISIVAAGLLVTGVFIGTIWLKRRRYRSSLAEDSDVRQLNEDATDEDGHSLGENEDSRHGRTFPTSYRQLENTSFPQEYDGTPV